MSTRQPYVKFRHFAMEAKSLNANRACEIVQPKRSVLLAAMVKSARARTIDDIVIMMIKKFGKIHRVGKTKLTSLIEIQALTALMSADKLNQECKEVFQCSFPLQDKKKFLLMEVISLDDYYILTILMVW